VSIVAYPGLLYFAPAGQIARSNSVHYYHCTALQDREKMATNTVYLQALLQVVAEALILGTNSRLPHRSPVLKTRFFLQSPCFSHIRSYLSLRYIVPYHIYYHLQGVLNNVAQKLDLCVH